MDEALPKKKLVAETTRKVYSFTYVGVFLVNLLVDFVLPPVHEGLLGIIIPVKGGGLLDDEALGLTVPPHEQIDWLVQVVVECLLKRHENSLVY